MNEEEVFAIQAVAREPKKPYRTIKKNPWGARNHLHKQLNLHIAVCNRFKAMRERNLKNANQNYQFKTPQATSFCFALFFFLLRQYEK